MKTIINVLGWLQIVAGVIVLFGSKSAIHEILATTAFGFGVLSLGFGAVLGRLDRQSEVEGIRITPAHAAPATDHLDFDRDPKLR